MGEALGGSVQAMMRAAGFEDEKTFFKAVEAGQIMAEDVLPKFGKELSKMAREGGALDAVTKKTRAEMNRFFNTLTMGKDTIFQSGMGAGLAYMFGELSDVLKDNKESFQAFGAAFKGVTYTLVTALKILIAPFEILFKTMYNLFGEKGVATIFAVYTGVKLASVLAKIAMGAKLMAGGFALANLSFLTLARNMARFALPVTAALGVEDYAVGRSGGNSLFSTKSYENSIGFAASPLANLAKQAFEITIGWKSEEAKKLIDAEVSKKNQQAINNLDAEN